MAFNRREYDRERRTLRKEKGLCWDCGKTALPLHLYCGACLYKRSLRGKKYQREHRASLIVKDKKKRDKRRLENRCVGCNAPLMEEESVYCMNCKMQNGKLYPKKSMRGEIYATNY